MHRDTRSSPNCAASANPRRGSGAFSPGPAIRFLAAAVLAALASLILCVASFAATGHPDGDGGESAISRLQPVAVVFAGRVAGDTTSTRIYFDFDRKIAFSNFFMDNPDRLVIDGPSMLFRFAEPDLIAPRGLVSFLRYGAIAREKSRIVISLSKPAKLVRFEVVELEKGGKYRLLVDLAPADPAEFRAMIEKQQRLVGTSGEVVTKGDRLRVSEKKAGRFTVVIDPGHGGIDGGARGVSGTQEKDLTLAVGRLIAEKTAAAGPFDVKMTREDDFFMSLGERVNFARRHQADLVISIHANSLRQNWVRGASVYTLSKKASDELAHELAQSENMSDLVAGLDNPEQDDVVSDILADLTARETTVFSRSFSSILIGTLEEAVDLLKNPQRSAAFAVLKAPEIPGVLVELGYLSNREDEKMMNEPEWQDDIARQVSEAVRAFFEPRLR